MFPKRSNIIMNVRCDIQTKTTYTNDTGQKIAGWVTTGHSLPCGFAPSGNAASIRAFPTAEWGDYVTLFLPHDTEINYQSRVVDIKNVNNEIIYSGPFEVREITKPISFSGKVQYLTVILRNVYE